MHVALAQTDLPTEYTKDSFDGPFLAFAGPLAEGPELDEVAWYGGNSGVNYRGGIDSRSWKGKQYRYKLSGTQLVYRYQTVCHWKMQVISG